MGKLEGLSKGYYKAFDTDSEINCILDKELLKDRNNFGSQSK